MRRFFYARKKVNNNTQGENNAINSRPTQRVNGAKPDPKTGNVAVEVGAGGIEIDDEKPSSTTAYSGSKTDDLVNNLKKEVDKKAALSDKNESDTTVYSSRKTVSLLNDKFSELSDLNNKNKGAALVGYNKELDYPIDTIGSAIKNSSGGLPLFSVLWWASRDHVPEGYVVADGQELSQATYPDAAQAIIDNKVPVVPNDAWLSNPTARGCYVATSSAGYFRLPDYNGRYTDSLGALFLRGGNGDAANGYIQLDGVGNVNIPVAYSATGSGISGNSLQSKSRLAPAFVPNNDTSGWNTAAYNINAQNATNNINLGSDETRPLNISGCWVIKLFGAVTNSGSADAAQLASDYANLSSRLSIIENASPKFTIIYPNGGTMEKPANVSANNRYILNNPYSGVPVIVMAELFVNNIWADPKFIYQSSEGVGMGVVANHLIESDSIIVQTGSGNVMVRSYLTGGGHGYTGGNLATAPCRVKVWRV